jgi:hypothetical protein
MLLMERPVIGNDHAGVWGKGKGGDDLKALPIAIAL